MNPVYSFIATLHGHTIKVVAHNTNAARLVAAQHFHLRKPERMFFAALKG